MEYVSVTWFSPSAAQGPVWASWAPPGRGLALGADGSLYAVDSANNRIVRYDGATGNYLGSFSVSGTNTDTAITVSPTGRLYMTNGEGGGTIFDAKTGATLGTFSSSLSNTGGAGDSSLALNPDGYLYLYDPATGYHQFYDPAAMSAFREPANYATLSGLAALGFAAYRRRRR